jgi:hypothetical protein
MYSSGLYSSSNCSCFPVWRKFVRRPSSLTEHFCLRDRHVLPLQPLYNGPYAVLQRSLHHVTLQIGDKEDKVSTPAEALQ